MLKQFFLYSISLQGPEQIHVSKFYKDSRDGKFLSFLHEDARTLYETFRKGAYDSNNGPCLGWRDPVTAPYTVSFAFIKSRGMG